MGCINSSSAKKLSDAKHENVFHVFLQPNSTSSVVRGGCWGYIELTTRELIFASQGESIVWLLQHLRRYGLNGDVFSFEAGRRCMTGPGIFRFRCEQPERLYQLFQRYINPVSYTTVGGDDAFTFPERVGVSAVDLFTHPSHIFGVGGSGRSTTADTNPHTNNYLEPAPMSVAAIRAANNLHESFSSSPLSLDLDSPDSVPSLSFTNEVVHFHANHQATTAPANGTAISHSHPSTPGVGIGVGAFSNTACAASSNLYMEQPVRVATCTGVGCTAASAAAAAATNGGSSDCITVCSSVYCTLVESNNATTINNRDTANGIVSGTVSSGSGTGSTFSTLSRKTVAKRSSLDVPPEECAPMLLTSNSNLLETLHNYANIDNLGLNTLREVTNNNNINKDLLSASERCYENINRADLPLLLQPPPATRRELQQKQQQNKELNNSTPQTPTTPPKTVVNYIVLDLDQPRSPTQYSPKTCFGSGSSISMGGGIGIAGAADAEVKSLPGVSMITSTISSGKMATDATGATITTTTTSTSTTTPTPTPITLKTNSLQRQHTTTSATTTTMTAVESRLGYSTIDFIKTCALIKSSTHGADFEHEEHEESRITRHSKCVQKAYSISE